MRGPASLAPGPEAARGRAHEGQSRESLGGCCRRRAPGSPWGLAGLRTAWGASRGPGSAWAPVVVGRVPTGVARPTRSAAASGACPSGWPCRWARSPAHGASACGRPDGLPRRVAWGQPSRGHRPKLWGLSRPKYGVGVTSPLRPPSPASHWPQGDMGWRRPQGRGCGCYLWWGQPPCPPWKALCHLESWLSRVRWHRATRPRGRDAALPVPARPLLSILVRQDGELGAPCRAPRDHRGPAWAERLSSSRENRQGSHASTPAHNGC